MSTEATLTTTVTTIKGLSMVTVDNKPIVWITTKDEISHYKYGKIITNHAVSIRYEKMIDRLRHMNNDILNMLFFLEPQPNMIILSALLAGAKIVVETTRFNEGANVDGLIIKHPVFRYKVEFISLPEKGSLFVSIMQQEAAKGAFHFETQQEIQQESPKSESYDISTALLLD